MNQPDRPDPTMKPEQDTTDESNKDNTTKNGILGEIEAEFEEM